MAAAESSAGSDSPLQASVARIRTSARWLLGAFGAIGVALAVGAQFSNLGKLEGNARDWALVGVGLTFVGLGVAIAAGASVLAPRMRTLKQLSERAEQEPKRLIRLRDPALRLFDNAPELLSPFASVGELWAERTRRLNAFAAAYAAWSTDPVADRARVVENATKAATIVEAIAYRTIDWANYATVRALYRRAVRFAVLPGVLVAAIGLTIFALKIPDVPPESLASAEVQLRKADLRNLDLSRTKLHGADLEGANLAGAKLVNADLSKAHLDKSRLTGANLTYANLEGASLKGASIDGVVWKSTTCPDGRESNDVGGSCIAHLTARQ